MNLISQFTEHERLALTTKKTHLDLIFLRDN